MDRADFISRIYRDFGAPYVKVELSDEHINDAIDEMMNMYKQWAIGNIVKETYLIVPLEVGKSHYKLPDTVQTVVSYKDNAKLGGINTLFTIENYLYNKGILNPFEWANTGSGILSYHLALDFLDTIDKYTVDTYTWIYHNHTKTLEISPAPTEETATNLSGLYATDAHMIMIRTYALMGTSMDTGSDTTSAADYEIFEKPWALKYTRALCKKTLGMIRRKFSGFQSIGNTGIDLDGDSLISEANEEIRDLEEQLKIEEVYEGGWIIIG